jgi:hypothetical protein
VTTAAASAHVGARPCRTHACACVCACVSRASPCVCAMCVATSDGASCLPPLCPVGRCRSRTRRS